MRSVSVQLLRRKSGPVKLTALALTLVFASCAASPSHTDAGSTTRAGSMADASSSEFHANRIAIYIGQRSLDEDDYEPVEDQVTIGFEFAHEHPDSVVGWEVGLMGSADEGEFGAFDVEAATGEIYGGARKSCGSGTVRPYIGGGLSFIRSAFEVEGFDDVDDASLALYAHGGVRFDISPAFSLGLDLRGLFGSDLELAGVDTDADYGQFALFAGFGF